MTENQTEALEEINREDREQPKNRDPLQPFRHSKHLLSIFRRTDITEYFTDNFSILVFEYTYGSCMDSY